MIAAILLLGIGTCVGMICERYRPNGTDYWRGRYIDQWDDLASADADQTVIVNEWP